MKSVLAAIAIVGCSGSAYAAPVALTAETLAADASNSLAALDGEAISLSMTIPDSYEAAAIDRVDARQGTLVYDLFFSGPLVSATYKSSLGADLSTGTVEVSLFDNLVVPDVTIYSPDFASVTGETRDFMFVASAGYETEPQFRGGLWIFFDQSLFSISAQDGIDTSFADILSATPTESFLSLTEFLLNGTSVTPTPIGFAGDASAVSVSAIPLPAPLLLLGGGVLGLAAMRRRVVPDKAFAHTGVPIL